MRILILILLLPTLTLAQEYELQSQPKVRVDGKEKSMARKSRPSEQVADEGKNDKPKDPLTWAGQVGYSIRTDLADQIERRRGRVRQRDARPAAGFATENAFWRW